MLRPLLILRPEPGAHATAAAARALGLDAITAPLFSVAPLAWEPPPAEDHDALLLTSAQAVRHAGPALGSYAGLPVWTVGEATAAAARAAGLAAAYAGTRDAADLFAAMADAGLSRPLHLTGRDHRDVGHPAITVTRRLVYTADPVAALPPAASAALDRDAVVLLHSPRAADLFARLLDRPRAAVAVAFFSPAVFAAAGPGWRAVAIAPSPNDAALLAAAAGLCDGAG